MLRRAACLVAVLIVPPSAGADEPSPARQVLRFRAFAAATLAPADTGFFNDASYGHNTLRLADVGLAVRWQPRSRLRAVAELRALNGRVPRPYGLYLRATPHRRAPLHLLVGLVPPTFGGYRAPAYGGRSPLLATPIGYQYLTTLRSDAAPASADELLRQRGGGWLVRHGLGNSAPAPGLPLVDATRADGGLRLAWDGERVAAAAAVTQGSLSRPRVEDDNAGKQVALRASVRPHPGARIGISHARGAWLGRAARAGWTGAPLPAGHQSAWGGDVELSGGPWLGRAETIVSGWSGLPVAEGAPAVLRARASTVEIRRRLAAGVDLAVRAEHLGFSDIRGSARVASWDAPVVRFEAGASYAPRRHLVLTAGVQRNRRDGGRTRESTLVAGQVLAWF